MNLELQPEKSTDAEVAKPGRVLGILSPDTNGLRVEKLGMSLRYNYSCKVLTSSIALLVQLRN